MKELSCDVIARELSVAIKYSGRNNGAVKRISKLLSLSPSTIYDYLEDRIKISLSFLHAAVIATDGDPEILKFLEPDGWMLVKKDDLVPDKKTLAEECLDDLPALADYHAALNNPDVKKPDIKKLLQNVQQELRENYVMWCQKKGVVP